VTPSATGWEVPVTPSPQSDTVSTGDRGGDVYDV